MCDSIDTLREVREEWGPYITCQQAPSEGGRDGTGRWGACYQGVSGVKRIVMSLEIMQLGRFIYCPFASEASLLPPP